LLVLSLLPMPASSPKPSALERLFATGKLVVATTNSPTTCYDGPAGPTGYECDLLNGLARSLRVGLDLRYYDNAEAALAAVHSGRADLGAAGIEYTPLWRGRVRFTHAFQQVNLQLVYNGKQDPPSAIDALGERKLVLIPGSGVERQMALLQKRYDSLKWQPADPDDSTETLLDKVAGGDLDYTVAESDIIALSRHSHPELKVAFPVSETQFRNWTLPPGTDDSLFAAIQHYLYNLDEAELAEIRDRYFGRNGTADYEGVAQFSNDVRVHLPRYRSTFEQAAKCCGLDWRVLAAIGYQESHWNPDAISSTGVRGLMMLTLDTAGDLRVDRQDPEQCIRGAARYLAAILQQLPASVAQPDRTWMALAAYNQGLGHVMDARELTAKLGGNPDHWVDVRNALPLLTRPSWFKSTQFGYARGFEAMYFVRNVRNYFDVLTWMTADRRTRPGTSRLATGTGEVRRLRPDTRIGG
jgi:membrane-bound lytic murein transglycosylase F